MRPLQGMEPGIHAPACLRWLREACSMQLRAACVTALHCIYLSVELYEGSEFYYSMCLMWIGAY